ncbi:MarP family serine protease [Nocardia sp. NPDC052566]|uniref:MarP family serine protease n=1 Tax=Nocardia sp. NPDC052566 TaxID=3364330 RepID=UPI0037CBBA3E
MTLSNWLDLVVLAGTVFAGFLGWRRGAIVAVLGFLGVVGGGVAGTLIAAGLLPHVAAGPGRLLIVVTLLVGVVAAGQAVGDRLGLALRATVRGRVVQRVDAIAGSGVQALAVPLTVWLLAVPLAAAQPGLAAGLRDSRIVRAVDGAAPYWLAGLPSELAGPLRESGLAGADDWTRPESASSAAPPNRAVLTGPAPANLQRSVLRIHDIAGECERRLAGTGFVLAPQRVLTNAHVVEGATEVSVDTPDGPRAATVAVFDPSIDIAVLHVPGLTAPAVTVAPQPLDPGADAIVVGYPEGGRYTAAAARVRSRDVRPVPDIYRSTTVSRQLYAVSAPIRSGNSGGPLIDTQGRVLGVVFGVDPDNAHIGYAMNLSEVLDRLADRVNSDRPVSTGPCQR